MFDKIKRLFGLEKKMDNNWKSTCSTAQSNTREIHRLLDRVTHLESVILKMNTLSK